MGICRIIDKETLQVYFAHVSETEFYMNLIRKENP